MHDDIGVVFTPSSWARWLIEQSRLLDAWISGATICDPTAGTGIMLETLCVVAEESGIHISDEMLNRLYAIERNPFFLKQFSETFQSKFRRRFPERNLIPADIITQNPRIKVDRLIGNPPWVNFTDLSEAYKEQIKPYFFDYGLVDNARALLLGESRIDIAALIIMISLIENLEPQGEAHFFVPMSLFLNDGAHTGFRKLRSSHHQFALRELWDFKGTQVFPGVATRCGAVHITSGARTTYPIPYSLYADNSWERRQASPIASHGAPLAIDGNGQIQPITVSAFNQPRQGVNTCGANSVFIFKSIPPDLPGEFIYPMLTSDLFQNKTSVPGRYVLLPYCKQTAKPLQQWELEKYPSLYKYLRTHEDKLKARKGTLIKGSINRDLWWALLGVGPYCFAPYKIVWQAMGARKFIPRIVGVDDRGQHWQGNQAMHAFIPCRTLEEAKLIQRQLLERNLTDQLQSMNMEGTCNWAQPGRIKRFLSIGRSADGEIVQTELF